MPVPRSQIKVRDFSRATVSISPAEYASWSEARNEILVEAKVHLPSPCLSSPPTRASSCESTLSTPGAAARSVRSRQSKQHGWPRRQTKLKATKSG